MKNIKTYKAVLPDNNAISFDIKRMENIYEKAEGEADAPHRHDYYVVLLVKNAKGKHIIDFNEFDLRDHQIYFISPGQVHQIKEAEKSFGFAITFSPQFMMENGIERRFIEDLYLFHDFGYAPPLSLNEEELNDLISIAENMLESVHSDDKFRYQSVGAWLKLLLIRCHNICALAQESNTQKVQAAVTLLKHFKTLLEEKYREWHKVNQYAQELNVSADYLNASIKSLTGKHAKAHIQTRLTVASKRLLLFSDLSNKEIAYHLGFSEPANFSQFFKKCTGRSPSQFRK